MKLKQLIRRYWRVAELETAMQIASGRTPRWHQWLTRFELAVRKWSKR